MSATSAVAGAEGAAQTASTTQNETAAPATQPAPFYSTFTDPDLRGYAENKAWKSPEDAIKSYREYEKSRGIPQDRLLALPDPNTGKPEEWNAIYDRLGRPTTPQDYKLESPKGADPEFEKLMRPLLHAEGVSQKTAANLQKALNEYGARKAAADEKALQDKLAIEVDQLHREWPGDVYHARAEMARRAFNQYSEDIFDANATEADRDEVYRKFDQILGPAKTVKIWAKVGEQLGGGKGAAFVGDNQSGNSTMTPEGAKARKEQLMADPEWGKKALIKGSAEYFELDRLQRRQDAGH